MNRLKKAARNILDACMDVKESEKVLVLIDSNYEKEGKVIFEECKAGCNVVKIPIGKYNGEEPPKKVAKIMKEYDVIIMLTTKSLSHTRARRNATQSGARIASMPGITRSALKRLDADYEKITRVTEKINKEIFNGRDIHITTKKGTDIILKMNDRMKFTDQGLYHKPGEWGNLPAGEACGAPVMADGIFAADASFGDLGKLRKPVRIKVEKGRAVGIDGGLEAKRLKKLLEKFRDRRVYKIAELGIGTNHKAKITGCVLEDEKVLGTAHIALGNNTAYGGKNNAPCHLDGIFRKPTILVGKKTIMKDGKLNI
ncbi:aminopeptidase [Candidatus Woesearchaeota archaeon]|nr:aminopeptidase [Candidatus Woesearchaeota archaeon]